MSEKKIRVEIITPVHNRRDITLQCLRSLSRLNTDGLEIHAVIVDDGSTDGTSEAIEREFSDVEIIKGDGNLWFSEGTNVGIRAALKHNPDYVLMINDDQVFDSDFLRYMVDTAEKYPHSVVGSLLLLWDMPHKLFQVAPVWNTWAGGWQFWENQTVWTIPKKPWEVEIIVGNCVLVPVKAIHEEGLMNSRRYPNFGDAEYTPRLKKKGWRLLIDPRARVFCQPNTIPQRVSLMTFRQKVDSLVFNLRHTQNLRRRFYAYIDGAPNRFSGLTAFIIFFVRLAKQKIKNNSQAICKEEKDMAVVFAESIVED
ncbi:MAG: glycosyltransferase family 2 protein [Acidobacteria bacterium]|nr:glycosyltransferase family 2 protein [Acidobacteriota bacterium]MCA1639135.1 glycosyltransferase family 2 protein [Acidobacteriota bacterium]